MVLVLQDPGGSIADISYAQFHLMRKQARDYFDANPDIDRPNKIRNPWLKSKLQEQRDAIAAGALGYGQQAAIPIPDGANGHPVQGENALAAGPAPLQNNQPDPQPLVLSDRIGSNSISNFKRWRHEYGQNFMANNPGQEPPKMSNRDLERLYWDQPGVLPNPVPDIPPPQDPVDQWEIAFPDPDIDWALFGDDPAPPAQPLAPNGQEAEQPPAGFVAFEAEQHLAGVDPDLNLEALFQEFAEQPQGQPVEGDMDWAMFDDDPAPPGQPLAPNGQDAEPPPAELITFEAEQHLAGIDPAQQSMDLGDLLDFLGTDDFLELDEQPDDRNRDLGRE